MSINVVSLIVQSIFFALGVYVYLFSRGFIKFGNEEIMKRSEEFRSENETWTRLAGLALAAVMGLNIVLQVTGR